MFVELYVEWLGHRLKRVKKIVLKFRSKNCSSLLNESHNIENMKSVASLFVTKYPALTSGKTAV